jgi:hypothetical protein
MACSSAGRQPRQAVLQQVVAGAAAHGGHRGVFADFARYQDERHDAVARAHDVQRLQAREARQVEVGHDGVPGPVQRRLEVDPRVDAHGVHGQPVAAQVGQRQFVVEFGVLQVQNLQRPGGAGHAGSIAKPRRDLEMRPESTLLRLNVWGVGAENASEGGPEAA